MPRAAAISQRHFSFSPARWIWYPSARTLPNTFVLFRKQLALPSKPVRATGWISADSRYLLSVNGKRAQWGPSVCDPRTLDADPIDLTPLLREGANTIGAHVLYFGQGDGTYVAGKPGFIFRLDLEFADGRRDRVISDASWLAHLDRAHPPGQYKRWYLRALQEEFDARLFPVGWDSPEFSVDTRWLPAMELNVAADKPPIAGSYPDSMTDTNANAADCSLIEREVAGMKETPVPAVRLASQGVVRWQRDPADWFELRTPGFQIDKSRISESDSKSWRVPRNPNDRTGHFLTFEMSEQIAGFPYFEVEAPAGTCIEMMWNEAHDPNSSSPWLDNHFHLWARYICREGLNRFVTYDFECPRWIQLHIRDASEPVTVREVGVLRRTYRWANEPNVRCGEPALQRLFDSCLNTLDNNAQGAIQSDGARERQQYSGDGMAQMHSQRYAYGETQMTARFIRTMSQGLTHAGYLLDCWPAMDRMCRIPQRELGLSQWGPLLDIGVCLIIDTWSYYRETGDAAPLRQAFPRYKKVAQYFEKLIGKDGLLGVEETGVPVVWMDHYGYKRQRHKQCSFNLLVAAMYIHALPAIATATGEPGLARKYAAIGKKLVTATQRKYWDAQRRLFIANRPWRKEEGETRLDDLSLAFSIIFGFCPKDQEPAAVEALASISPRESAHFPITTLKANDLANAKIKPSRGAPEISLSYPPNQRWRYEALARHGRVDVVLKEWRELWANMPSVKLNCTIAEEWTHKPDTVNQWNHNGVNPLSVLFMDIAGIRPLTPGFKRCAIRPQLGDLKSLELISHTPHGPLAFKSGRVKSGQRLRLEIPKKVEAELWLPATARVKDPKWRVVGKDARLGITKYRVPSGSIECDIPK